MSDIGRGLNRRNGLLYRMSGRTGAVIFYGILASVIINISVIVLLSVYDDPTDARPVFASRTSEFFSEQVMWSAGSGSHFFMHLRDRNIASGANELFRNSYQDVIDRHHFWKATTQEFIDNESCLIEGRYFLARGWPLASVWCEFHRSHLYENGRSTVSGPAGGIALPLMPWEGVSIEVPKIIPYRVMWSGMVIDLLVMFALCLCLALMIAMMRALVRSHRRACLYCGYDLSHIKSQACPECGSDGQLLMRYLHQYVGIVKQQGK